MYLKEMTKLDTHSIEVKYNLSGTPSLNVKLLTTSENKTIPSYSILSYNKELLSYHKDKMLMYRSVVFSHPELKLLSFSPPKMEEPNAFFSKEVSEDKPSYYVNEYIDGLLIHLFYDERYQQWQMTTHNSFITPYDGTRQHCLSNIICNILKYNSCKDVSKLPFWEGFSKECCYNFTLTNKYSHTNKDKRLYLTSVYKINNNHIVSVNPDIYERWNMFDALRGIIYFPKNYSRLFEETSYIQDDIRSLNLSGLVIMDTNNGNRCKYISETYNIYKRIRHIEPYYLYIYICYAKINQPTELLSFLYKSRYNMKKIHCIWKLFIHYLHQTYLNYYVFKKEIHFCSDQCRSYLRDIHQIYYIERKQANNSHRVNKQDIMEFLMKKHPQEVFHLVKNI